MNTKDLRHYLIWYFPCSYRIIYFWNVGSNANLSILDFVLLPFFLGIVYAVAYKIRNKKYPYKHPWRKYFIPALTVKILGALFIGLIWFESLSTIAFPNTDSEVCGSSHETYVINGSSKLGKYRRAAVAVDNALCSTIGRQILEKNGTTVDAALAAAICNGVMNAHSMGIGGGCFMVIYSQ